jgi:hypothetical protein
MNIGRSNMLKYYTKTVIFQYSGGPVETFILLLAGVFTVVMLILLPKYAKFIHNQPKMQLDKNRQLEDEHNPAKNRENPEQDV